MYPMRPVNANKHYKVNLLWQAILDKSGRDFSVQVKNSFFKVRVSIFKSRSFLFKLRCFKWRFFFHVEIFISRRDFHRKSRIFFLSRIYSCQGISVQVEILIFSSQDFFFMSRSINSSRHFSIQGESRDVCLDSLLVFPALDKHHGGR